jgi:hypothetical protein
MQERVLRPGRNLEDAGFSQNTGTGASPRWVGSATAVIHVRREYWDTKAMRQGECHHDSGAGNSPAL